MGALISRVADHCFWFGRYLERAEATARTLAVTHLMALGAETAVRHIWLPVIIVAGEEERFGEQVGLDAVEDGDRVQEYMTWDTGNPVSIWASVRALRENARAIRDQISLETWNTINELHVWMLDENVRQRYGEERYDFYRRVWQVTQQAYGLLLGTMGHDTPLDFILLGSYLERGSQTARVLDVHHHANKFAAVDAPHDSTVWISFLRALGGYETYMKRAAGKVREEAVIDFLVLENRFPRSIAHSLSGSFERFLAIRPADSPPALPGRQSFTRLRALRDWVRGQDRASIAAMGVHELLTHVVDETHEICTEIGRELLGMPAPMAPPVAEAASQAQISSRA